MMGMRAAWTSIYDEDKMISEGLPGLPEEQGDDGDEGGGGEDDLNCLVTSALLWLGQPLILKHSIEHDDMMRVLTQY